MGGAYGVDSEAEMQQRWAASSAEVRRRRGRPIVPAAQLRVGLGVHRALLFKFLADASNVPCRLIGSGACKGEHLLAADAGTLLLVVYSAARRQHSTLLIWSAPPPPATSPHPAWHSTKLSNRARCCQNADALEASATAVVRIGDRELAVDLTAHPGAVLPWQEPAHGDASAGKPCMH